MIAEHFAVKFHSWPPFLSFSLTCAITRYKRPTVDKEWKRVTFTRSLCRSTHDWMGGNSVRARWLALLESCSLQRIKILRGGEFWGNAGSCKVCESRLEQRAISVARHLLCCSIIVLHYVDIWPQALAYESSILEYQFSYRIQRVFEKKKIFDERYFSCRFRSLQKFWARFLSLQIKILNLLDSLSIVWSHNEHSQVIRVSISNNCLNTRKLPSSFISQKTNYGNRARVVLSRSTLVAANRLFARCF